MVSRWKVGRWDPLLGLAQGSPGVWTWRLLLANDAGDTQTVSVHPVGLELRFPNHI